MNKKDKENNSLINKEIEAGLKRHSIYSNDLLSSNAKFGSANLFQLISAAIQITLGVLVITLSVVEIINPRWLAGVMSLLGCVSVISGVVYSYKLFSRREELNTLINKAIKRVITFQN